MGKLLEYIFAYICKTNYLGECSPADQIYTITKNISEKDISIAHQAVHNVGRVDLYKIDMQRGVSFSSVKAVPNYDMLSYTYLPAQNGEYGAFSCASLRETLKDKSIRGSKELSHVIAFNEVKEGFYFVDMFNHRRFSEYKDISLNEAESISTDNEDLVCEVKPAMLEEINWDTFYSRPLISSDISNLGRRALKVIAEFVHALLISLKERKTLYLVYNPEEYSEVLNYLRVVLKLFPASIANSLSFITALGKTSRVNVDICGIPTSDAEYISSLRSEGNVIKITGLDVKYLDGEKGAFARFLENASIDDFNSWIIASERYSKFINSFADIDVILSLYLNIKGKEFDVENPKESLKDVSNCIRLVIDKFEAILKIEGEIEHQITGVSAQVKQICGAFEQYSINEIDKYLIEPIVELYNKCNLGAQAHAKKLLLLLRYVLFGIPGQSSGLERKHYETLSVYFKKIQQKLGNNYHKFIDVIENDWTELKAFFDNYLNESAFAEPSATIMESLLDYFLYDFSNTKRSSVTIRDYFVSHFLKKNPEKFDRVIKVIFEHAKDGLDDELNYIFDTVIRINENNRDLVNAYVKFLCNYVKKAGLLSETLTYVRNRYANQFSEDGILNSVFKLLLADHLAIANKNSFDDIISSYNKTQALLGENSSVSLKRFVYETYVNSILIPNCENALKQVRFENFSEEDKSRYHAFVEQLGLPPISEFVPEKILKAIEEFLVQYNSYKSQTKLEDKVLEERIEFVVREFLLLERKTIYKLLCDYVGKKVLLDDLKEANILGTPYKHPNFLEFAEKEALKYLNDENAKNKLKFCNEIKRKRKMVIRDVLGGVVKDLLFGLIGSAIFAAIMALIAGLVGGIVYTNVANSHFKTAYVVFTLLTAIASFVLFWANYNDRRLRNVYLMSAWQSLLFIISTLGVFTLVQYILILLEG